jgi:hypothetical protein
MPLDRSVGNYFDNTHAHLMRVARWTGPASYVTGGEDVSPAVFGLGKIIAITGIHITDGVTFRAGVWNVATQRLQWMVPNTNVEVAGGVNLSTFTGSIVVYGN